jgi:hypothetical protein
LKGIVLQTKGKHKIDKESWWLPMLVVFYSETNIRI